MERIAYKFIPLRACSICECDIGYEIRNDKLYFNSSCDCSQSEPQLRDFEIEREKYPDIFKSN